MLRAFAALVISGAVLLPAFAGETQSAPEVGSPQASTNRTLPLEEARALALHAMQSGRHDVAAELALAMLRKNPEDSFAHLVMASLLMQAGHMDEARPAARKAFRYSDTPRQKHEAARVAALIAARQDRYLSGQIWMRRALQAAPNDATRARSVHEFRSLRREAKLRLSFSGSVVPSSNVNNGTADRYNVIDGVPLVGILPASSQALSGIVMSGSAHASYRLHRSERSETRVTGGLQIRRVALSEEARDKAPRAEDADYGSTFAEIGLSHTHVFGEGAALLSGNLSVGQVWSAGELSHSILRGAARVHVPVSEATRLSFGVTGQRKFDDTAGLPDVETLGLQLALGQRLGNGDELSVSGGLTMAYSDNGQARSTAQQAVLRYDRAKPVGPVSVSASLSYTQTTFPDYRILFFGVPGGRQDKRTEARVDMTIDKLSYAGFVPTISIASEWTESNVSRFETEQMSISLGLRSQF